MNDSAFQLLPRRRDAHKGDYGRVLLIAGSPEFSGAAIIATRACLSSGAGLVTVAAPVSVSRRIAVANPAAMSLPLPETPGGRIAWAAKDRLAKVLSQFSSVAVGPGLGQSVGLVALVAWLYRECPCPMVLDADALNAMSAALSQGRLERAGVDRPARLLTPHPGEFARLWQAYRSRVARAAGRWPTTEPVVRGAQQVGPLSLTEEQAIRFAADLDVHVVLKGAGTLITDGRRVARNLTGNPGMATGGSGDGLTGILAADLAQGSDAFTAARRGCFVHGRAGDLAAQAKGEHAMNASDLLDHLSEAWKTLEKCREHME